MTDVPIIEMKELIKANRKVILLIILQYWNGFGNHYKPQLELDFMPIKIPDS